MTNLSQTSKFLKILVHCSFVVYTFTLQWVKCLCNGIIHFLLMTAIDKKYLFLLVVNFINVQGLIAPFVFHRKFTLGYHGKLVCCSYHLFIMLYINVLRRPAVLNCTDNLTDLFIFHTVYCAWKFLVNQIYWVRSRNYDQYTKIMKFSVFLFNELYWTALQNHMSFLNIKRNLVKRMEAAKRPKYSKVEGIFLLWPGVSKHPKYSKKPGQEDGSCQKAKVFHSRGDFFLRLGVFKLLKYSKKPGQEDGSCQKAEVFQDEGDIFLRPGAFILPKYSQKPCWKDGSLVERPQSPELGSGSLPFVYVSALRANEMRLAGRLPRKHRWWSWT